MYIHMKSRCQDLEGGIQTRHQALRLHVAGSEPTGLRIWALPPQLAVLNSSPGRCPLGP